jgi:hypothetical protein
VASSRGRQIATPLPIPRGDSGILGASSLTLTAASSHGLDLSRRYTSRRDMQLANRRDVSSLFDLRIEAKDVYHDVAIAISPLANPLQLLCCICLASRRIRIFGKPAIK